MDKIILVGAGGHARSCIDVIKLSGFYKIAGLVEKDNADGNENLGYPIIGTDDDLHDLRNKYELALVTVGLMTRPAWTLLHKLAPYQDCSHAPLPIAESLEQRIVNLPSSSGLI